jgi:hypothetical protein
MMTIVELIAIFQYKNFWEKQAFYAGFYGLMGFALFFATWF